MSPPFEISRSVLNVNLECEPALRIAV